MLVLLRLIGHTTQSLTTYTLIIPSNDQHLIIDIKA